MKRLISLLVIPMLLAGCTATLTNLTPLQQTRSTNNLYTVEAALSSKQQALRWDSIRPHVIVGEEAYPMSRTPFMSNRFEAVIPVPPNKDSVYYKYRFDFDYNALGKPKQDSTMSPEYLLKIVEEKK